MALDGGEKLQYHRFWWSECLENNIPHTGSDLVQVLCTILILRLNPMFLAGMDQYMPQLWYLGGAKGVAKKLKLPFR